MTRICFRAVLALVAVLAWPGTPALAEVRLAQILGSHMVVQHGRPIRLWGTAQVGEVVTATLADEQQSDTADGDGRWLVQFAPRPPNDREHTDVLTITVTADATEQPLTLENVLVGDVWLCAGQSNMGICVRDANDGAAALATCGIPGIRLFDRVPYSLSATPQDDLVAGTWRVSSPDPTAIFSAVGYYFGRQVYAQTGVPVGLISCSLGGSTIEAWISQPTLEQVETAGPLMQRYQDALPGYNERYAAYRKLFEVAVEARNKARAAGEEWWKIPEPGQPFGPHHRYAPFCIFNDMIHPLKNVSLRGAIWYQGESSADRGELHRHLLPALIDDWRRHFGEESLPFGIVQLPNANPRKPEPAESEWAELREAQFLAARRLSHVGLAVTIDVGDPADLHPGNKRDVGERLARWALGTVYGHNIAPSGPMYVDMTIEGPAIRLRFDQLADGLLAQQGNPLTGFAIAGEDRKFVWAQAHIDGSAVVVRSDTVKAPVAVRYGWADNPDCNLANTAGLLASPFRTDDWPVITTGRR